MTRALSPWTRRLSWGAAPCARAGAGPLALARERARGARGESAGSSVARGKRGKPGRIYVTPAVRERPSGARGTLDGMRRAVSALAVSLLVLVCVRCSPFESDAPPATADGGTDASSATDGAPSGDAAGDGSSRFDAALKDCQTFEQTFEAIASAPWTGKIEPTGEQKHSGANAGKYVGNAAKFATLDVPGDSTHVDVEYWIWLRSAADYAEIGCNVNLDSGSAGSASIFVARNATQLEFTGEAPGEKSVGSAVVVLPQSWTKVSLSLDLEGGKIHYAASNGATTFSSEADAQPGFVPSSVSVKCGLVFVGSGGSADLYVDDAKVRVCRR